MMVLLMATNIVDENFDFSFKDVPRVFRKKVKAQLELMGQGQLADVNVINYIGDKNK